MEQNVCYTVINAYILLRRDQETITWGHKMADAWGCISTCTTKKDVCYTVGRNRTLPSSGSEKCSSAHWKRSIAEPMSEFTVCVSAARKTVCVFAARKTVCVTARFVDATQCLSGSSEMVNQQRGKKRAEEVCPGGVAFSQSASLETWAELPLAIGQSGERGGAVTSLPSLPGVAEVKPRGESSKMASAGAGRNAEATARDFADPDRLTVMPNDTITDTGVRLTPRGSLALCNREGTEHIGLVCGRCQRVSVQLRAWGQCKQCGEMLLQLEPSNCQPRTLQVDWETGLTAEISGSSIPIAVGRNRQALRTPLGPGPVVYTHASICSTTRETRISAQIVQAGQQQPRPWPSAAIDIARRPAIMGSQETHQTQKPESLSSSGEDKPGVIDVGSPGFQNKFGSIEEGIADWGSGSEVSTEWDCGTEGRTNSPHSDPTDDHIKEGEVLSRCARNLGFCEAYANRVPDLSPPRNYARAQAQNEAYTILIKKAETPYVPVGKGDKQKLPRLSRLQRLIQRKVAMEYGYDYPYAPREIMQEVETKRVAWGEEAVWDFMFIPKPYRNQTKQKLWEEFLSVKENWSLGRSIHIDRVVIQRPGKQKQEWACNIWGPDGKMVHIPHPDFYY